ncbi:MAG: class I SAM-dependent methyltransferase, partial [Planctomycetales bacterium]
MMRFAAMTRFHRLFAVAILLVTGMGFQISRAAAPLDPILKEIKSRQGILVHLGCGDGSRGLALRGDGRFVVQAIDRDPTKVAAARKHIQARGEYGAVSANVLNGAKLPYADNLVNVLVVDDAMGVTKDEMMRVLCPLGAAWLKKDGDDAWQKIVKPWPATMDEWTHFLHDASGNAVSKDGSIGPPRRLQWTGGAMWTRGHEVNNSMPAMVSARGRMFYVFDRGVTGMEDGRLPEKWTLVARDAFNGSLLWSRKLDSWGSHQWKSRALRFFGGAMARRLVADKGRLFVTFDYGTGVEILDAATGRKLFTADGTAGAE